jgi:hypothetical protein
MKTKAERRPPEIVLRDGKPAAVILDIDEYQEMLERLEDLEDLKELKEMREKSLKFEKLGDFLREYHPEGTKPGSMENKSFLSEHERASLEHIVRGVQEFSKQKVTTHAKKALRELCAGIFESEEDLASNHDFFLYGAPRRK